jgi:pimeloyl-ACP methyl ester carboxylesterase
MLLLLGGYSYGAMVTAQLPPLPAILAPFAVAPMDSDTAQIRIRAETLAAQQRDLLSHASHRGLRVGDGGSPKRSHDGRRSFSLDDAEQMLKRGAHDLLAKTHHHHHHHASSRRSRSEARSAAPPPAPAQASPTLSPPADFVHPRPAYLLVSPLQGIINHLATMSRSPSDPAAEAKLRQNPTLAVYGDKDVFVPVGRLRSWTTNMEAAQDSCFRGRLVDGAGHFWVEEGVLREMKDRIVAFARELQNG